MKNEELYPSWFPQQHSIIHIVKLYFKVLEKHNMVLLKDPQLNYLVYFLFFFPLMYVFKVFPNISISSEIFWLFEY